MWTGKPLMLPGQNKINKTISSSVQEQEGQQEATLSIRNLPFLNVTKKELDDNERGKNLRAMVERASICKSGNKKVKAIVVVLNEEIVVLNEKIRKLKDKLRELLSKPKLRRRGPPPPEDIPNFLRCKWEDPDTYNHDSKINYKKNLQTNRKRKKKKHIVTESASVCTLAWALPPPLGDIIIEPDITPEDLNNSSILLKAAGITDFNNNGNKTKANKSTAHLIPQIRPSSAKTPMMSRTPTAPSRLTTTAKKKKKKQMKLKNPETIDHSNNKKKQKENAKNIIIPKTNTSMKIEEKQLAWRRKLNFVRKS